MRTVSGQTLQSAVENSSGAAWTLVWIQAIQIVIKNLEAKAPASRLNTTKCFSTGFGQDVTMWV